MSKEVFDQIAESWYRVRHWPRLRKELEELAQRWPGGRLLNVGCAHGADFLPFIADFELWGVDFSGEMLKQGQRFCAKFRFTANLVMAEAVSLPFGDEMFDYAVAVASYHHIKGKQERETALKELKRVLKPGGEAFLTVWNWGQPRFWLRYKEERVPWKVGDKTVYRYYHLFSYREFEKLLDKVDFEIMSIAPEKAYRFPVKNFSRNICALVKKK
jgi:ubiquinone/menaquinone biosynthesis C-methylase UbiE